MIRFFCPFPAKNTKFTIQLIRILPHKFCRYLGWLLALLWSCQSESVAPEDIRLGFEYFPLSVGQYSVYEVEDIRYIFARDADTSRYQLREVVADSFPGVGGEIVYRLERYRRTVDQPWQLDSVWTARKNTRQVVVVENNIPLIKLVFPSRTGITWDGNALNSRPEQIYSLAATSTALKEEISSPLDSLLARSLTVIQQESQDTIITYTEVSETYVEDIGLFYKKSVNLQYCASTPECVGLGILESGWQYTQTLIDHGTEEP